MESPTEILDHESLKTLLLDLAQERTLEALLRLIADKLADRSHVALARIWLVEPGDICSSCRMRDECPDQTRCLHLVASAGSSAVTDEEWTRLDGHFSRFPLGVRKVGHVGATGQALTLTDAASDAHWYAQPDWAEREGIRAFAGQPLIYQGETLGVLAVFLRVPVDEAGAGWLRLIADHAAAAISHARAFHEIERLREQLQLENEYLREEVLEAGVFGGIVGESASLRNILKQIELVAPTDASVLILGESGTGKELVAREIHERSQRAQGPMIRVNCASIPRELYESEFFGHVKGAFTGAVKERVGRFELADGGTLFLDEVGEIPRELQSKLLRVLQEGQFERLGEEKTRSVDVRIVAATNRNLKEEMDAGRFRQDLYYRLNVFPVEVVPLRDRKEDIPLLAAHFVEIAGKKLNCPAVRLTRANVLELQSYDWPGNVRELQNVIERAAILAQCGTLKFDFDLPDFPEGQKQANPQPVSVPRRTTEGQGKIISDAEMKRIERDNVLAALERTGWKIYGPGGAAELLEMKPTTLSSRIRKLGLKQG